METGSEIEVFLHTKTSATHGILFLKTFNKILMTVRRVLFLFKVLNLYLMALS